MSKFSTCLILILVMSISVAWSQSLFTEQPLGIPPNSVIDWGDYDNDGDQDLLYVSAGVITLLKNTLTGTTAAFSASSVTFPSHTYSTFGWFDINRDGYLDIYAVTDAGIRFLIQNGVESFSEVVPNFNYAPAKILDWADMDNDGLLDLYSGDVYKNRGNYEFERKTVLNLSAGKFFDYDSDGNMDVFADDKVYRNLGNYVFTFFKSFNADLTVDANRVVRSYGSMLLDINADSKPEYIGMPGIGTFICNNALFRIISADEVLLTSPPFQVCGVHIFINAADYDNDGVVEYIIQRSSEAGPYEYPPGDVSPETIAAYTVNAQGNLVPKYSQNYLGSGSSRTVDVNKDGRPDLSLGGRLLVNTSGSSPVKPSPPATVSATTSGDNGITFSWSKGSDDKTPANSLTYNLFVARGPEGVFNNGVSLALQTNRMGLGNAGYNLDYTLHDLPNGIYQYRVQSVDQALNTSVFSAAKEIEVKNDIDAVSTTRIDSVYNTVFNSNKNQYLVAYAQRGTLYGEFIDGKSMQRMNEPFIINTSSGSTQRFMVGYHSAGDVYVVTWTVANKIYGKIIKPSDFSGAGAEKLLYTAATPIDYFHLVGKQLLYSSSQSKIFFPWMEKSGTKVTLRTMYLTASLASGNITAKEFNILQGVSIPDYAYETPETIPLEFESDIDFVTSSKVYALAWNYNGHYSVPGFGDQILVGGDYLLESLKEDGSWLGTTKVFSGGEKVISKAPAIKYNPFNDNLACVYSEYSIKFLSKFTGLQRYSEVKARLLSIASTGLSTFQGDTIDVSISTPPNVLNLGNVSPTVVWSSNRNEFLVAWNKKDFKNFINEDNLLLYQRINPYDGGSLIEPAQTILTSEPGYRVQLNYHTLSGDFLLGWLGGAKGNFKRFRTYKDPAPVISQLSSVKAYSGTKIIITGLNFGKTPYINSVMFGDTPAKIDTLFFDTKKLQVTVPPGLGRRIVPVTVTFDDQTSNAISFENISSTSVTSVTPLIGALGDIITITGTNFPDEENLVQVTFGSIVSDPTDIISSIPTEIKVKVPQAALRGSNQVVSVVIQAVPNFGTSSFRVIRPPVIETVTVDGEFTSCKSVTITGHDFSSNSEDVVIKVGDVIVRPEDINLVSVNGLNFRIPLGAEGASIPITVFADDREGVSQTTYKVSLGSEIQTLTNESEFEFTNGIDHIAFTARVYNQCSVDAMKFWSRGISGSDTDWKSMDLTDKLDANRVDFTLDETTFTNDPIGLEAFYEVVDKSSKIKYSETFKIYRNYPELDSSNVIPNLRFGGSVADYSIVSLPYEFQINKITTVFRDLFNAYGYDKSKWRISHYEPSKEGYAEYLDGLDDIDPGKGYWLIARYPQDIFFEGAKTLNVDNGYYEITLVDGWNQIGNPFNFNLSWADIMKANGNPTAAIEAFRTFKDGTWSEGTTIERFRGGFVRYNSTVGGASTFGLKIPVMQNKNINGGRIEADKPFPGDLNGKEWRIRIDLSAGQLKNKLTSFGMHPKSLDGEDERDEHVLPPFIETIDAVFPGSLSTSMVNTSDQHSWEFEVLNTTGTNEVTMSWDNTLFGTSDRELYLHDKVQERLIDMRAQNSYTFVYSPGHSFAIHFGDNEYIKETSRPGHLTLATAYPNPMSTSTTIAFSLSKEYQEVRLTVYDVQGKEVSTILQESLEAGFYETHWEGNDKNGSPLPNGLWIYRLQVTNGKNVESAIGKVLLTR